MATAFLLFNSAKFNYKLSPAFYIFKTIVLVLLSQTIVINPYRCPNLVIASPISTHLIDQFIIKTVSINDKNNDLNPTTVNLTNPEQTTSNNNNNNITNVIEKLAASSKNLTLNLTNTVLNNIEPLFAIHHQHSVADNYDTKFDFNSPSILQHFKVLINNLMNNLNYLIWIYIFIFYLIIMHFHD